MFITIFNIGSDNDCIKKLEKANSGGLLGAFKPKCNIDGSYKKIQYHGRKKRLLHILYYQGLV